MFIEKEHRISRDTSPSSRDGGGWNGRARRRASSWHRPVRTTLYIVLGSIAGMAALAGVALTLAPPSGGPQQARGTVAEVTATPQLAPAAPPPAASPEPVAAAAPPSRNADVVKLQEEIRKAADALADLRSEAERLRGSLEKPTNPRPSEGAAITPPTGSSDNGWQDAERTVEALQSSPASTPAPTIIRPSSGGKPASALPRAASTPVPRQSENTSTFTTASPREHVFLFYRGGSTSGPSAVADLARRLVDSEFVYADTRSASVVPVRPTIRYFFPQDADPAQRLADLLAASGIRFSLEDHSAHPGHASPGTLDVWVSG